MKNKTDELKKQIDIELGRMKCEEDIEKKHLSFMLWICLGMFIGSQIIGYMPLEAGIGVIIGGLLR